MKNLILLLKCSVKMKFRWNIALLCVLSVGMCLSIAYFLQVTSTRKILTLIRTDAKTRRIFTTVLF